MDDGTAVAAGRDALALEGLRHGWGEAYEIGCDDEQGWHARRRDGIGGLITAAGPDELWPAVCADYELSPVSRGPGERP